MFLKVEDPQTGKVWEVSKKNKIKDVSADVYARWVINCVVPKEIVRKVVKLDFLEPIMVKGKAVLSLCCIFMRHSAPVWMPLHLGPASHNCALRIACIDKRDNTQAVWVDHRHTDCFLAPVLEFLGFPEVHTGLKVIEEENRLELTTKFGAINCRLTKSEADGYRLFDNDEEFGEYFCAGIRSYSEHGSKNQIDIIDLHKLKDNKFKRKPFNGTLSTPYGTWFTESVYLTENGMYQWVYEGKVS